MKKLLTLLSIMGLGLIGCSSASTKPPTEATYCHLGDLAYGFLVEDDTIYITTGKGALTYNLRKVEGNYYIAETWISDTPIYFAFRGKKGAMGTSRDAAKRLLNNKDFECIPESEYYGD